MKRLSLLLVAAALSIYPVSAATFSVTSTADAGGTCPGADCTLRQAITNANGAAGADTITFNIPASDPNCDPTSHVCTITPASALPAITGPVTIDGYTQPGASANTLAVGDNAVLLIELNGTSANGTGLSLGGASGGSTISGLVINRFVNAFEDAAIRVVSGNNEVTGCFIGVDPTGNTKLANGGGVRLVTGANNRIGGTTPAARNIVSGNNPSTNSAGGSSNIAVTYDGAYPPALALPTGTIIRGNYIGTNAAGTVSISDPSAFGATDGILISGGTGTIIGGTDADDGVVDGKVGARNVISGNLVGISTRFGIYNGDVTVEGNFIGVNAAGTAALGNYMEGINFTPFPQDGSTFTTNSLTIGGTAAGAGNVIAGQIYGAGVFTNARTVVMQGNRIGTDAAGTLNLGNGGSGMEIITAFPPYPDTTVTIGGATAAARNIISANGKGGNGGYGIKTGTAATITIQGNFIGTQGDGVTALGNAFSGILVNGSAAIVTIGGMAAGESNIVAYNSGADNSFGATKGGIIVGDDFSSLVETSILGNTIFANGGLGIDLAGNGPTPNDTGDGDTGPNNLQNFPVLTSASIAGGTATIAGTLNSSANTQFTVEFFANAACDPSGFGEGQTFIGRTTVTTNTSGDATFSVMLPTAVTGGNITATATDPAGNTSEFSACFAAIAAAPSVLANISTRLLVETGNNVLIGGFIITGTQGKEVIVRGIGPSLPLSGTLANPQLDLYDSMSQLVATNNNWQDAPNKQAIIDTGLNPSNALESAILMTLAPGAYTAILSGVNATSGIGLVEAYDLDQTVDSKLANISTRGLVQTGNNVMIGGFIAVGTDPVEVIVRAIGPSIPLSGTLADPTLELHDSNGVLLAANDNWRSDQEAAIAASGLPPTDDLESAILETLLPAAYTAIVGGANGTTGVALVEVYQLN